MTQEAVVTSVYDDGTADVVVERSAICGGDCNQCEGCIYENTIKSRVQNPINAPQGSHVYIETDSGKVMWATVLIYVFPLIAFFIGYGIAALAGLSEHGGILCAFVGLVIGFAICAFHMRKNQKKDPTPAFIREIIPRI